MKEKLKKFLVKLSGKKILTITIFSMAGALLLGGSLYLMIRNNNQEIKIIQEKSSTTIEQTTTVEQTTAVAEVDTTVIPIANLNVQTNLTNTQQNAIDPEKSTPSTETVPEIPPVISPISNAKRGIDVSRYQGTINWAQVKAAGYDFAIIRVGYRGYGASGILVLDPQFYNNINGAIANGVEVGTYFFSQALTPQEAAEEASLVIGYLAPYKNSITYPVAFDWEGYDNSEYRVYYGKNSWTPDKLNALSSTFCDMIKNAGYTPMHYGNKAAFNSWGFSNSYLGSKYKIWFAHPTSGGLSTPTDYTGTFQFWQYSFNGSVPGISGSVDLNILLGSLQLNLTNTSMTYPLNTSANLLDGVTAVSTLGTDLKSSVSTVIKNGSGVVVSQADTFSTAGTYNITYSVTDVFGTSKSATAVLTIT